MGEHNSQHGKTGSKAAAWGRKSTPEQCENSSRAAKKKWAAMGDELRAAMNTSEASQNRKEAHNDPKVREKQSRTMLALYRSEKGAEIRRSISEKTCQYIEDGKVGVFLTKKEWLFNPFTNQDEFMHSSWESAFLQKCIRESVPVTKKHGLRIPWMKADRTEHLYVPDFVTLDGKTVYEIKGCMADDDKRKIDALQAWAREKDIKVEIVTKKVT